MDVTNFFKKTPVWLLVFGAMLLFLIFFDGLSEGNGCRYINRFQGFKSFFLFPVKKNVNTPDPTMKDKCYFEFFEGIGEAATIFKNDYAGIDKICSAINKKLPVKSWNQCYFQLGTGLTYTKRSGIKDSSALVRFVDSKIDFCSGFPSNFFDCVIGVYNGVNLAYQNFEKDSVYPMPNNDPFWVCKASKYQKYKPQCTRNIVSFLYLLTDGDLNKGAKLSAEVFDKEPDKFELVLTYFSSLAYQKQIPYDDIRKLCTGYKDAETRFACIEGYATGVVEVTDGSESKEVIKFCVSNVFTKKEVGECIRRGFSELPVTDQKISCYKSAPKGYEEYCARVGETVPVPHWNI